ncbi:hypothetical protein V8C42DRAFT_210653 [Trichoderma barbatum]
MYRYYRSSKHSCPCTGTFVVSNQHLQCRVRGRTFHFSRPRQLMPAPPLAVHSSTFFLFSSPLILLPLASSRIVAQIFPQWPNLFSLTPSAKQLAQAHRRRPDRSQLKSRLLRHRRYATHTASRCPALRLAQAIVTRGAAHISGTDSRHRFHRHFVFSSSWHEPWPA